MALKNLTVEEMVAISVGWVGVDKAAHLALKANARLSALLPDIERAHVNIYRVTPQAVDPRKAELAQQAVALDLKHDLLARGIYGVLTEYAHLVEDGAEYLKLRDYLYPNGIAPAIQVSFRGQAGYADLLKSRLNADIEQRLQNFVLPNTNLLEKVTQWLDTAQQLGNIEEQRAHLEKTEGPSFGQQVVDARNQWIRVVNAFISLASLSTLDPQHDLLLFGPLREAESRADARALRRKGGQTGQKESVQAVSEEVPVASAE